MSNGILIPLTNYKERSSARVPEGTYTVQVEDTEETTSKAGNPMINVWLRIIGGDHDGQTLVDRLTITEKALFRVVAFLNAAGIPTPRKDFYLRPESLQGKVLNVDVADGEPYNGQVRSEVKAYARSSAKVAPATAAAAADLPEVEDAPVPADPFTDPAAASPAPTGAAIDVDHIEL